MASAQEEVARLEAELAAARAQAGMGGVLTATTVGNGSERLMLNRDVKGDTDEQKAAEEAAKAQQDIYADAAKNAAAEAKAQAESRQAAENAQRKAEDDAMKAAKAQQDAAKAAAKANGQ